MPTKKSPMPKTTETKRPIVYKSIGAILRAKRDGTLPRGFRFVTDNDSVTAYITGQERSAFDYDYSPGCLFEEAMRALGIKAESV